MKKIIFHKSTMILITTALAAGILFGWLLFHRRTEPEEAGEIHFHEGETTETIWTCSMHPQVREDEPGQCPICAMDLVPLSALGETESHTDPDALVMTESAMKLASVQTSAVKKEMPRKTLHLQGKVRSDERNIAQMTARFGGRIEELSVNYTGQKVSEGKKLATIFSPALVTAQKELLEALKYKETNSSLYEAARSKLKLWDLTEKQINDIEQTGSIRPYFEIISPISGTATTRYVSRGNYVEEGDPLFEIIDLDRVWVMFDAYESDLPWIAGGDRVEFTLEGLPGRKFSGKVSFIDPVIDPGTRVARVRVEQANPGHELKPGMFVNGILSSGIDGMASKIMVPKSAVLWTGKRSVVYVRDPGSAMPSFRYREIVLGPEADDSYVVSEGLAEGEEIVTHGVFKIDAAAQLAGKPSMMNPEGSALSTGHDHGNMEMSD